MDWKRKSKGREEEKGEGETEEKGEEEEEEGEEEYGLNISRVVESVLSSQRAPTTQ
jgi:hypothetical protein